MAIGTDTITIYRGEDLTLAFTHSGAITGWTITFNVKLGPSTRLTKSASIVDGSAGTYSVALTDADTDTLTAGTYPYDVWRTTAGSERLLAQGQFVVIDVVRSV